MWYDLSSPIEKEQFIERVYSLSKKGSMVELVEKKPKRTIPQNSYLHLLLGLFAMTIGETLEYVKTEYFKRLCNDDIFLTSKWDERSGRYVEILRSSRDISTAEMTTAIDRFKRWALVDCSIVLPDASDREWLWSIEKELNNTKKWL